MEEAIGKKTSKTTSNSQPWAPAQPLLLNAGNDIMNTVNANQPNLNAAASQAGGYATQLGQKAFGDQPGLSQGYGFIGDTLGGKYLNSNPYIDSLVNQGEQDAANSVNSTFSLAGRTGSEGNKVALAKGVAQAGDQVRANEYNQERANQMAALGQLPSFTNAQYAGVTPYTMLQDTAAKLPYYGTSALGNIGSLYGGYGTQTGTQPGGWGSDILNAGAALGAAAILHSDRRLKTNIKLLRRDPDGLGWYEFAYKAAPDEKHVGVMADEVKQLRPWAYVPNFHGDYAGVDYAALGKEAA